MRIKALYNLLHLIAFGIILTALSSFTYMQHFNIEKMPYAKVGLSKKQAAAHLLNKFTFGATPSLIDHVEEMGLENWFEAQILGIKESDNLTNKINELSYLQLSTKAMLDKFPKLPKVKNMAIKEGFITEAEISNLEKKELALKLKTYSDQKGFVRENELYRQFYDQKILNAIYSNNQIEQVMTDFWFNHFNVSMTKNQSQQFIPNYERDAIKPNLFGNFEDLVLATAKHPAMLTYLDNAQSQAAAENTAAAKRNLPKKFDSLKIAKKAKGGDINENYAREVMELHTLGVDGGYTQQDVTNVAKVLTGWTINPISLGLENGQIKKILEKVNINQLEKLGVVQEADFMFVPQRHDVSTKIIMGKTYENDGYNEGVNLLKFLANHNSTAQFISKKLATRFVNDAPKQILIDKMARTFLNTKGNIKAVLYTLVNTPEFWDKDAQRAKTKSPFEYAISSLKAIEAEVENPNQINLWITKMGQQLYHYSAPTGFPDKGQYWINTGSLLNRMNFGLALASKRIPGVQFDLAKLNQNKEPESAKDALVKYAALLLPQRDLSSTITRLTPLIEDPTIANKINNEAAKINKVNNEDDIEQTEMMDIMQSTKAERKEKIKEKIKKKNTQPAVSSFGDNSMLAQVVGIIIGSPEFQRR
jgi:uncharacterized protein (DUF1800 family)